MTKLFLLTALCALFLSGCEYSNYTYIQTPLNVPHVGKKGEAEATVYVSAKGIDVQGAYAFTNHFAVMANVNSNPHTFSQDPTYHTQAFAVDVGAGYYTTQKKYSYGLYGGLGMGDFTCHDASFGVPFGIDYSKWDNSGHYQKLYVQSSITRHISEHCTIGLALRVSGVHYDSYAYKHASYRGHDERELNELIDTVEISKPANAIIVDPAFVLHLMADKRFSFYSQIGVVWGIGFGSLTERKTYDFTGYKSSNSYAVSSAQADRVSQPVVFPLSLYAGVRFRICK